MTPTPAEKSKAQTPMTDAVCAQLEADKLSIWDALTAIQTHARSLETRLHEAEVALREAREALLALLEAVEASNQTKRGDFGAERKMARAALPAKEKP